MAVLLNTCSILVIMLALYCSAYPMSRCNKPCSQETCKDVPTSCEGGYLKPNASYCGCCPACVKYLGRGDRCRDLDIPPVRECGAGLHCSVTTGTCVPTSVVPVTVVPAPQQGFPCMKTHQSTVTCSVDGTYAPRQCDEDSCYCVAVDGKELVPYRVDRSNGRLMECVCARVQHALQVATRYRLDMCDRYGNYKKMKAALTLP